MTYNWKDINDFKNTSIMIIGGLAASVNKFIFIAPTRCVISNIKLVSDTATTDSNGTNKWTFQIANLTQTLDLCSTAKTTNGAEMAGDTAYDLGVDQNLVLSAGDVLELQITKGATPTDLTNAQISCALTYIPSDTYTV